MVDTPQQDLAKAVEGPVDLDAELIALPAARLLAARPKARVIQVYDRSINLTTETGGYLALVEAGIDPGPFSISLMPNKTNDVSLKSVLGGDYRTLQLVANEEALQVGRLSVNLRPARTWDPGLFQGALSGVDLAFATRQLRDHLNRHAPGESLPRAFASDTSSWIAARMRMAWDQIREAILCGKPERCRRGGQLAAGAGIGLTPAGDDFLMGVLLALWLGLDIPQPYIDSLLSGTVGRTGRLSTAFLYAAARGEAGQAWHSMARAIAEDDGQGIRRAAGVLLKVGHTSGADGLFGFTMAMKAIDRRAKVKAISSCV